LTRGEPERLPQLSQAGRDELNVGLPSDWFQVDWHIASDHVAGRLRGDRANPSATLRTGPSLSALLAEGTPLLNRLLPSDLPRPPDTVLPIEGNQLLVQIPACF
jgi:hypothetical protein